MGWSEAFRKPEWDTLKDVCDEKFPDEELLFEMAYSLIDIENQASSLNQRKGILDTLEKCIKHTFYKDEADATQYYLDQLTRKKTYGGKYDEKFFANIQEETEEFASDGEDSSEEPEVDE